METDDFLKLLINRREGDCFLVQVGSPQAVTEFVEETAEKFRLLNSEESDIWLSVYPKLGIEEAREINAALELRPTAPLKLISVGAFFLTREGQNALLKSYEKDRVKTVSVLAVANAGLLLPTLRSRFSEVRIKYTGAKKSARMAALEFLAASPAERLRRFEVLFQGREEADRRRLIRGEGLRLVEQVEYLLLESARKGRSDFSLLTCYNDLKLVRTYLNDQSSATKMLLEHLALALPVINLL